MIKQNNSKIAREIDKLSEPEGIAVLEYISKLISKRNFPITHENNFNDDLIASLSEKRENECARQVIEWEKTRRKSFAKAA